ncbi:hypothetical protein L9F63_003345, partial [Diploptera punctata]
DWSCDRNEKTMEVIMKVTECTSKNFPENLKLNIAAVDCGEVEKTTAGNRKDAETNLPEAHKNQPAKLHDGAPPHYAIAVREILDDYLQNRWVGRRGPIELPAHSPDLTAYDYWLWDYLKEKVYARKPQDVDKLKLVIEEEIRAIPLNMYDNAMNDFPKRCQLCLDVNGEQFQAIK